MKTSVDNKKLKEIMSLLKDYQKCVDPNSKRDYQTRMDEREKIKAQLKAVGEELNTEGGMTLMQGVAQQVLGKDQRLASYLNTSWSGVGYWMG